jgi:hypothetical protein
MKIDARFPRQIALTLFVTFALAAYPLSRYGSPEVISAVVAGALLSTVNVLLGFFAIEYAFDKSYTVFLKAVLGGMGLRMMLLLGALIVLILVFHMHTLALTISLLTLYVIYLVLEILFIQKKVFLRNQR